MYVVWNWSDLDAGTWCMVVWNWSDLDAEPTQIACTASYPHTWEYQVFVLWVFLLFFYLVRV